MMKLKLPLFLTRMSIAVFLLPWIVMRFLAPENAIHITQKYYKVNALTEHNINIDFGSLLQNEHARYIVYGIGVLWAILWIAFVLGVKKRLSYGLVFLLHLIGTLFTLPYFIPNTAQFNIMFFAALPTLMAMLLLYLLRKEDTLLAFGE
ncbi:MAG: hypothetical protein ACPGVT_13130 [Maricaulaceae bacterium]